MRAIRTEPDQPSRIIPADVEGEAPLAEARPSRLRRNRRSFIYTARASVIVLLLFIWWMVTTFELLNPLLFPTLSDTAEQVWRVTKDGTLFSASLYTLETAAIGFTIGMVTGTLIGIIIGLSDTLTEIFQPFITVLNAMPRIALAPLYVLWFGIGQASGVALVVSIVFFVAALSAIGGTRAVDSNHLTIARLYGASRGKIVWKVVLPATVPWIITAARLSLAYALAAAIFSEMFLGQQGLGYLIAQGSGVFNMAIVFGAIFASLVLAVILNFIGDLLEEHLLRWRSPNA